MLCLSSWFWGGCRDQCLGSQKEVFHRNPLLVRGILLFSCTTCCLLSDLFVCCWCVLMAVPHLQIQHSRRFAFMQDGSRGSGGGEEGRVQPPVWHLGPRHHRHWTGRASAAHVRPPPNEVCQRRRHWRCSAGPVFHNIWPACYISEHWCWCPRATSSLQGWKTNPSGGSNHLYLFKCIHCTSSNALPA